MNFFEFDSKIREYNNYKIIAKYILENNMSIDDILNEQGFFQQVGNRLDQFKNTLVNKWNNFRGNPYDVNSVVQILQKAKEFLGKDSESKSKFDDEISSLASMIQSISNKNSGVGGKNPTSTDPAPSSNPSVEQQKLKENYLKTILKDMMTSKSTDFALDDHQHKKMAEIYSNELAKKDPSDIERVSKYLINEIRNRIDYVEKNGIKFNTNKGVMEFELEKNNNRWNSNKNYLLNNEGWILIFIGKAIIENKNPLDKMLQEEILNLIIGSMLIHSFENPESHLHGKKYSDIEEIGKKAMKKEPIYDEPITV